MKKATKEKIISVLKGNVAVFSRWRVLGGRIPDLSSAERMKRIHGENKSEQIVVTYLTTDDEPRPIKNELPVAEYAYKVTDIAIKKHKVVKYVTELTNKGVTEYIELDHGGKYDFRDCYRTLKEAYLVADKKWSCDYE